MTTVHAHPPTHLHPQRHAHPKNPDASILGIRLGTGDTISRDTHYPAADGAWRPVVPALAGMRLHVDEGFFVRPGATISIEAPSEDEIAAIAVAAGHAELPPAIRTSIALLLEKIRRGIG